MRFAAAAINRIPVGVSKHAIFPVVVPISRKPEVQGSLGLHSLDMVDRLKYVELNVM